VADAQYTQPHWMDLVIMGLHTPEQIATAIAYSPQFQLAIRQGLAEASRIQPGVIGLGAEQVIRRAIVDATNDPDADPGPGHVRWLDPRNFGAGPDSLTR
jgi:hypothetical protein